MLTLRCTRDLLAALGAGAHEEPPPSSTLLGDWYACLVPLGEAEIVLLVSDACLLAVVLPPLEPGDLVLAFRERLRRLLEGCGIAPALVEHELGETSSVSFATLSGSPPVESIQQIADHVGHAVANGRVRTPSDFEHVEDELAIMPHPSLGGDFPRDRARELLGEDEVTLH